LNGEFRTGIGYDKHRLIAGGPLVLGGIPIDFDKKLSGHSDGDVLLHAVVDALLGAAALGDIGTHFPDTDPRWKNANSEIFLRHALGLTRKKVSITFLDCIILAEKPKLAPHFDAIRAKLATLLDLTIDKISLKAKTEEGLGDIGSCNAMAAFVAITVKLT